jgi:hypothetical protein
VFYYYFFFMALSLVQERVMTYYGWSWTTVARLLTEEGDKLAVTNSFVSGQVALLLRDFTFAGCSGRADHQHFFLERDPRDP